MTPLIIDPGSPWQNAWIESFNGRLHAKDWRRDYNANRLHSAHGDLTPTEFALQWTTTHQPQAA